MKTWKCPNCWKVKETEDKIIMILCGCGEEMEVEDETP